MLCQFTFGNFKSYKDEVTLDLCPANIAEHPTTLLVDKDDKSKFLPVAVIYGPNGGGKSNVVEAFAFLRKTVLRPPRIDDHESPIENAVKPKIEKIHFLFDDNQTTPPSSFEVIFRASGYEYKYILMLKDGLITEEYLYATDIRCDVVTFVFERTKDEIKLGGLLDGARADKLNPAMPLLQYLATTYSFDSINNAINWFKVTSVTNYGSTHSERTMLLPDDSEDKQRFFDILQEMDIPIKDILIERNEDGKILKVLTKYQLNDERSSYLNISQESAGTRKLLSFLMLPLNALKKGTALFVDELDAKLHPKLLAYIIGLFTEPKTNKLGAQLIFTSHDLYTMNNAMFRRDEIWFAAKGGDLSSRLYSLSEFKKDGNEPTKDENYGKQYIEGKYGADPYLKKIVDWEAYHEFETS